MGIKSFGAIADNSYTVLTKKKEPPRMWEKIVGVRKVTRLSHIFVKSVCKNNETRA